MGAKQTECGNSELFRDNELLNEAVIFAVRRHSGQFRKGTRLPYIVHPLETLSILVNMKADTALMAAGVLHDVIEDTDTSEKELLERFGEDVCRLVMSHSEDKSKSWDERKKHAVSELKKSSFRVKMLVMADKVSNLRSIYADYRDMGEELWERFNAPREKQEWYYGAIKDALAEMKDDCHTAEVYGEMVRLCKEIFG